MADRKRETRRSSEAQLLVERVRALLRLYGSRTARLASIERELRRKSLEQIAKIAGDSTVTSIDEETYLEDPELELRAIARSIAPLPPAARVKLVEALPGSVRDQVRSRIFMFEDILHLDNRGIQKLLQRTDTATMSLALVHASDAVIKAVFRNLSRRAAQMYREEIEYRQGSAAEEVQEARARVARVIMELADRSEIIFSPARRKR
ncbi:FliG C-terminal domain-containing protein [Salinispira pacifica]